MQEKIELSNRFMFAKVMKNYPCITKKIIESVIGERISEIRVINTEESIEDITNSKNVRLDVCVDAKDGKKYDIELQMQYMQSLPKRTRYYHAVLTHESLKMGENYGNVKDTIVIFVCMFDPFGLGKLVYHSQDYIDNVEVPFPLGDGEHTYLINAKYNSGISESDLECFISILQGKEVTSTFGNEVFQAVEELNADADWRNRVVTVEQFLNEEKSFARAEGLAEGLAEGREEGREEGIRLLKESKIKMAQEMLSDGMDISTIARYTLLSEEEISNI